MNRSVVTATQPDVTGADGCPAGWITVIQPRFTDPSTRQKPPILRAISGTNATRRTKKRLGNQVAQ